MHSLPIIHWVVSGVTGAELNSSSSSLATNRYRAILPARALEAQGFDVHLIDAANWGEGATANAAVVVLGKLLPGREPDEYRRASERLLDTASKVKKGGARLVVDFNDDHFADPIRGSHWRESAALADLCVSSTETLAQVVTRYARSPVIVIGDPVASPRGEPRVMQRQTGLQRILKRLVAPSHQARLAMVWYGHPSNWPAMRTWLEELGPLAKDLPWICRCVTSQDVAIQAFLEDFSRRYASHASVQWVSWSEPMQWDVVECSDIVLVPSVNSTFQHSKSTNRVADALHAGRFVIASPLPSYEVFRSWVALTDDPVRAVRDYVSHPEVALANVQRGQIYVADRLGEMCIGQQWRDALLAVASPTEVALAPRAEVSATPADFRLNLGCGDKILEGYTNVDVVASRAGRRPDVLCDLHRLTPFMDDSASEIIAIHVVEHFWRWEVEDVIREWVRVLKPGGRMVLECPNLLAACEEFLKDPDRLSAPDRAGQRTMWVFYGDPAWEDPYMIHRWGYTPTSLAQLMRSVGLVDVRQEPAQYKLREPRDMRVVGFKPAVSLQLG